MGARRGGQRVQPQPRRRRRGEDTALGARRGALRRGAARRERLPALLELVDLVLELGDDDDCVGDEVRDELGDELPGAHAGAGGVGGAGGAAAGLEGESGGLEDERDGGEGRGELVLVVLGRGVVGRRGVEGPQPAAVAARRAADARARGGPPRGPRMVCARPPRALAWVRGAVVLRRRGLGAAGRVRLADSRLGRLARLQGLHLEEEVADILHGLQGHLRGGQHLAYNGGGSCTRDFIHLASRRPSARGETGGREGILCGRPLRGSAPSGAAARG